MIIACAFTLGGLSYLLFILLYNLILHLPKSSYHLDYKNELDYDNDLYYYDEIDYKNKIYKKDLKNIKVTSIFIIIVYFTYLKLLYS
jgi:hypothetical protein